MAPSTEGLPSDAGRRFFDQAMELWIVPEVQARQERGVLPKPVELNAAQVLLEPTGGISVRLNEEVDAVVTVKVTGPIEKGQAVYERDIEDIRGVTLTNAEPSAAHVTMLRLRNTWVVAFDFRYNAERVDKTLRRANIFLDGAKAEAEAAREETAVALLFQAVELIAKARLLVHPNKEILDAKTHRAIEVHLHRLAPHNIDERFTALFKDVTRLRDVARYPARGDLCLTADELRGMIETAMEFRDWASSWAPERYKPD